ncbi:MAG: hypothetical protein J5694_06265 [Erysipelotrichaceae bacterium]|nr:hypothetical protein [Erysipelotrichaceae bacterium]MBO4538449.1 hypothetical protein [Erysipelotrichaceae bacterium]
MNNLEYFDISEIKPADQPLKAITYKPYVPCYICVAAGVGMLLLRHWAFLVLGLIFIGLSLFVLFKIKDHKVLDIYSDGVLIYSLNEESKGIYVRYDDLAEWTTKSAQGGSECVYFLLADGTQIYKDTFQALTAYRQLIKLMPEKESEHIRMEKLKGEPFSFSKIVNIFRRKK